MICIWLKKEAAWRQRKCVNYQCGVRQQREFVQDTKRYQGESPTTMKNNLVIKTELSNVSIKKRCTWKAWPAAYHPFPWKDHTMWNRWRVFTTTTYPHMWVFAWYPHRWELSLPHWGLLSRAKRQFSQWSLEAVTSWQNILSMRHGLWTCRESTSLSITSSLLNVTDVSNEKGMEGELWSTLRAPCVVSLYSAVRSWLLWEAIKM